MEHLKERGQMNDLNNELFLRGKGTEFKYDEYGRVTSARRSF